MQEIFCDGIHDLFWKVIRQEQVLYMSEFYDDAHRIWLKKSNKIWPLPVSFDFFSFMTIVNVRFELFSGQICLDISIHL